MRLAAALLTAVLFVSSQPNAFQSAGAPRPQGAQPEAQRETPLTAPQIKDAIDQLGRIDYGIRMSAARRIRRAPADAVVPTLIDAVQNHPDGYSRFRSLVLLSGLNDSRTHDVMARALTDKNDRLRAVAYGYFEHNADPQIVSRMLDALATEQSEFVRPALTRALAAYSSDARVREVLASVDWQVVSSVVARGLVSRARIPCDGRRSGSLPCERLGTLHTQRK